MQIAKMNMRPFKERGMREERKISRRTCVLWESPYDRCRQENIGGNNEESKLGTRCDSARVDGLRRKQEGRVRGGDKDRFCRNGGGRYGGHE